MNNIKKFINDIKEQRERKFFDKVIEKIVFSIDTFYKKIVKNVFSVKIENIDDIKPDKLDFSSLKIPKSFVIDNLDEISKYIKIPKNEFKFDKIEISNLKEISKYIKKEDIVIPDEFRINNLNEIEVLRLPENLKKISNKKIEKLLSKLVELNKKKPDKKSTTSDIFIKNKKANEYIPVRLVDYKGTDWLKSFGNSVMSFPTEINIKNINDKVINPATADKQLPDDHNVTVSNQISGFATETKQDDTISMLSDSIDDTTGDIITIDITHKEIHEGDHYAMQGYLELNNGDTHNIKLVTPDTAKWAHFVFDIKSTGVCTTYFDEDATGGMTGGSVIIPRNSNRNSSKTSDLIITGGVTACTGYGVRLESDKWGANGFKASIGGGSNRENEIILKQNTTYCRTFISGADNNIIQFEASWYEYTNK